MSVPFRKVTMLVPEVLVEDVLLCKIFGEEKAGEIEEYVDAWLTAARIGGVPPALAYLYIAAAPTQNEKVRAALSELYEKIPPALTKALKEVHHEV